MTGTISVEEIILEGGEEDSGSVGTDKGVEVEAMTIKGVSMGEGTDGIGQEEERKDGKIEEVRSGKADVEVRSGKAQMWEQVYQEYQVKIESDKTIERN